MTQKDFSVSFMGRIAILIASFYTMADMFIVVPLVGDIAMSIPEASGLQLDLTITLSQLTVIVGTLLVARLVYSYSKKTLMIVGGLLVLVFGGGGGLIANINYNLFMRAIQGLGAGMCITLIPIMIAEMFEDEKTRNDLIGIQAAVGCVFGALCSALAGLIAVNFGWQKSYLIYLFAVVIIFMQVFTIPKLPPEQKSISDDEKSKLTISVWGWVFIALLFGVMTGGVFLVLANLVIDYNVGDAALAGFVSSVITVGSFFGSAGMSLIYMKLKKFIDPVCWIIIAIGGMMMYIACVSLGSIPLLYAGAAVFGLAYGVVFPWLYAKAAIISTSSTESQAISLTNASYYVGMFVSAFFYQLVSKIFNNNSAGFTIIVMVVCCSIISLIMLIGSLKNKDELKA